jgi:amino-acid N-acetyltransferase
VTDFQIRTGRPADAPALHALITEHQREGHLLPRDLEEIREHAGRFLVIEAAGVPVACAELAPLSPTTVEIRSLVVDRTARRLGLSGRIMEELRRRAKASGYETICAFTHNPRFFASQNFSIVPHVWLPEKIAKDCSTCVLFRRCGQYAMVAPVNEIVRYRPVDTQVPHAVVA